jgi:hypothetical protein
VSWFVHCLASQSRLSRRKVKTQNSKLKTEIQN